MVDRVKLISLLAELVIEEQEYAEQYKVKESELRGKEKTNNYYTVYDFWRDNRTPNKATTNDALKLLARLSRQEVRKSKSWLEKGI